MGLDDGRLEVMRVVALLTAAAGGALSFGLMLSAGRRTPRLLLVLFVIWVLSPFLALGWATAASRGWPALTRATLYGTTLVVTLGSLAIYGGLVRPPAGSAAAFVYVAVPPASSLIAIVAVLAAALMSRRSRLAARR
jgi:hypothetical protein